MRNDPYELDLDHAQEGALKRVSHPPSLPMDLTARHRQIFTRFAKKDRSRDGLFDSMQSANATMNITEFAL